MIRNDTEYQEAVRRLDEEKARFAQHEVRLRTTGLGSEEVKRALDPLRSFHSELQEEVESYERLKRGDFGELINFEGLGCSLVALRIASGLTQRELADRLGVHESQVSRDERNEYHNITVERAARILDAMQAEVRSVIQLRDNARNSKNSSSSQESARPVRAVRIVSAPILTRAASFKSPSESQLVHDRESVGAVT